ncbi:hypothetical protein B9Z19DRAFT_1083079 [Tuber borchii]|uniref:Myb-like DNA-binding domain-containing protein n=1 Tax=Tuber borchii TaxID=42251 RepID=A0A2T6ZTK2_TUBBO|nr:hypothetical protein B9Z19DRAFT_1083079 [Tuber borchii]
MPPIITPNEEIIEFLLLCIEHNPGKTNFDQVAKESTLTRNASAAYQKLYSLRRKFRQSKPAPDPSPSSSSSYILSGGDGGGSSGSEVFGTIAKDPAAVNSPSKVVKKSPRKKKKRCTDSTLGMGVGEDNLFGVGQKVVGGIGDWRSGEGFGAKIG